MVEKMNQLMTLTQLCVVIGWYVMKTGHYYCKVIARLCFRILENSCSPRSAVAERVNLLPPVADFEMKEVRTKKKNIWQRIWMRRGSQIQGQKVQPESSGHRNCKAYAWRERATAQPGGNGEQPGLADKALASDKLLQDKAADRRVAGKAETDHRRL